MDNNSNMLQLCRLCLVKDDVNIPIFEEQGDIRQIFLKISSCLPVKVSRDDQLPKKICDGCSYKLDMLYEFWNTSANAEKQLLTWLGEAGMTSQMADGTISAVAQQIKPADAFVKQETIDPPDIHMDDDDDEDKDYMKQEENSTNVEEPPPKRARRTAAVKAAIALDQNSDDDDDSGEPMTKIEDDSEDSDNDDREPAFVDVPSTSADDQPGPSGVGKDGVEAPSAACFKFFKTAAANDKSQFHLKVHCSECKQYVKPVCSCPLEFKKCVYCQVRLDEFPEENSMCLRNGITCTVCKKIFFTLEGMMEHSKNISCYYFCRLCCIYFKENTHSECRYNRRKCAFCLHPLSIKGGPRFHRCFHERTEQEFDEIIAENTTLCPICNERYDKKLHKDHNRNHDYGKCDICEVTILIKELPVHKARIHLVCHICGIICKSFTEYSIHDEQHQAQLCEYCGKTFKPPESLKRHLKLHQTDVKVIKKCDKCDKEFEKRYLKRHMLVHTSDAKFKCDVCGKCFKNNYNRRVHMRIHVDVKPFECLVCQKTFTTKQWRDNHMKTHKVE